MLYLLEGVNSDSGLTTQPASFEGIDAYSTDKELLYPEMSDLRVIKTPEVSEPLRKGLVGVISTMGF